MAKINIFNKDTLDKLLNNIENDLEIATTNYLRNDGGKEIKELMSQTIIKKVYMHSAPKKYLRRLRNRGGLISHNNMKQSVRRVDRYTARGVNYKLINQTPRHEIKNFHPKDDTWNFVDTTKDKDFLYNLKDNGGVYNLWKADSYERWGNGGKPLHLNETLDEEVHQSEKIRNGIRDACIERIKKKGGGN